MSEFQVHDTAECSDGPKSGGMKPNLKMLDEFIGIDNSGFTY